VLEGITDRLISMSVVGGHARLLLVTPLFFACESWVVPRMAAFVGAISQSGVVPPGARPALDAEVLRTRRWAKTGAYDPARTSLAFFVEAKWTGDDMPAEALLGSADLQSLADLANAVGVVTEMRWITVGPRLLTMMTMAAVVPLTPRLLFRYPIAELAQKFFSRLVGL
jgi:hypothetical protein